MEATPSGCVAVVCALPKGWVARRPAAPGAVLHPGTAVRWEDGLWEVLTAEETAGGVRYELAPWDERHAVRLLVPYDERSEAERAADARDLRGRRRARIATLVLAPLAGLLPGDVQERLETELGLRATRLTLASVLAPMAAGTFALVMSLAAGLGAGTGSGGPAIRALLPIVAFLLPESFVRIAVAAGQGRPIGSVLGLPLYLAGRLAGLFDGAPEAAVASLPPAERRLEDLYLLLEPLLSFLPARDQSLLADRRGFAPLTWGRRTAWFLLVYPGLTAPAHAASLLAGGGGLPSFLLLALALVLGVEQVVRLRTLARGEPAPSLLGRLVAPLAAPLLR